MKFLDEIGPAGHLISSRDPFARSLGAKTCLLDGQSDSQTLTPCTSFRDPDHITHSFLSAVTI